MKGPHDGGIALPGAGEHQRPRGPAGTLRDATIARNSGTGAPRGGSMSGVSSAGATRPQFADPYRAANPAA